MCEKAESFRIGVHNDNYATTIIAELLAKTNKHRYSIEGSSTSLDLRYWNHHRFTEEDELSPQFELLVHVAMSPPKAKLKSVSVQWTWWDPVTNFPEISQDQLPELFSYQHRWWLSHQSNKTRSLPSLLESLLVWHLGCRWPSLIEERATCLLSTSKAQIAKALVPRKVPN